VGHRLAPYDPTLFLHPHCRHLTRESVCREAASFKRASGKSLDDVLEADFWGVSGISLSDCRLVARHKFRVARDPGGIDYFLKADLSGPICRYLLDCPRMGRLK
jgi:hypothetical protein